MIDLVASMAIFALVTAGIYQVFVPFLTMARSTNERLAVQQDVRLAMDRMARDLRESTASLRLTVYSGGASIGFVSARLGCTGAFTVDAVSGRPLWQAMVYVVRDAPSEEVRAYCDAASTFPAAAPVTTGAFRVLADNVQALTFTQSATGDSVTIELHERTPRGDADRHIRTEFVPQND